MDFKSSVVVKVSEKDGSGCVCEDFFHSDTILFSDFNLFADSLDFVLFDFHHSLAELLCQVSTKSK